MEMDPDRTINNIASSTNLGNEICDEYICIPEASTHLSVTTVLNYCKNKILNPYMRLLSFMGLRPFMNEEQEPCFFLRLFSYIYTLQVMGFMIIGYFLQYMSCFRRDRGFYYKAKSNKSYLTNELNVIYEHTCDSSLIYSFIVPSALHLVGYLHAVVIFRSSDDDQLPVLMERVFLSSTNLSSGFISQKKLVKTLWLFVVFSVIWVILSLVSIICMLAEGEISFKWMENSKPWIILMMKILLVICTLWHDVVQAAVVSNYCLQAQLLTLYVQFLREKLLQYPVQALEWMREIEDFKKLLKYLNDEIAPSVCLFTVVNLSFTFSGLIWLFSFNHIEREKLPVFGLNILNVILWIFISLAPFIQGARLTNSCDVLKSVGQEVRTRPYVHQETPAYELDSILMYTTSLKINARLFSLPIKGKYLCFCGSFAIVIILILGQCHYLN
ncbi:uncharacterized protein LOC108915584 [Anoplophora glabripennis]|uniref:uncharacterized protein LOC108915584 n=1 Tax=Anoplophora glabripennis TaxID=217634 RepID=UPI0008744FCB|nr:uncharacterized protein LOC108915584 [Anoplophora glabripennis]